MRAQVQEVVIVSGVRTAIGDFGGSLKSHRPSELAGLVVAEAVRRAGIEAASVGHCVFGNVIHTEPLDMYLSRVAALRGGLSERTPALTVNRLCGSGLQAVIGAAQQIQLGLCDTAVAGGAESMSLAPYHLPAARFGQRMGDGVTVDPMVGALTCPINRYHMGVTAENVAERFGITREQQDALAVESHNRAQRAVEQGWFKGQILPIELKSRKGTTLFDTDEHIRYGCTLDDLKSLRPAFKQDGTVTAGNASGLNDGAGALVLMARAKAEAEGRTVMARLVDYAVVGVDPSLMGIGPVPAIRQLLDRNGLGVGDIDVYEVNEAFAAQALAVAQELDLPRERLNPNGSGISLGHPIGATGAIVAVKAIHELARVQGRYAIVSLCIGGGQGIAVLLQRD
ncbi:acetyl-CoA C-acetyltransferase [Azotobacter beijerinckii]|uniref:Acetyl-CoA C-acetyltransferase n=1 Tax=Azotobacter beijerinckii TaxID=170623 RepID=A0A1H6UQP8_9GAMM|nr:beta-ketothiolase BktB [Azotobacter beijerinckii]SEI94713.1 acetyl-CoA C-acetyltransferase [Azotobacter beijerinckii]